MHILNLTREIAQLQFSIDELLMLKNLLMEAYQKLTVADFQERIRGITRDESIKFASTIGEVIDISQKTHKFCHKNRFIQSIQLIENQVTVDLTYTILVSIRSILNEFSNGIYVEDFQSKIGFDKSSVSSLLDSIHFDVVEKMEEGTPESLIHKKTIEISNNLNLKITNLEMESLSPRLKKECILKLNSHIIVFYLASQNNRKIFSGIQIAIGKTSHQTDLFTNSNIQGIRHSDLVRLVAYLELALTSAINDADLEKFSLSLFNSKKNPLLSIQVVSRCLESEEKAYLKIRFRLYSMIQKNRVDNEYFDIEETSRVSDIYLFISSIKSFLSELPIKASDTN